MTSDQMFATQHTGAHFDLTGRLLAQIDAFLAWAAEQRASDITIQSGHQIIAEIAGCLLPVTRRTVTHGETTEVVNRFYGSETGSAVLLQGRAIDMAYEVAAGRGRRQRWRINATGVLGGTQISIRSLPDIPPSVEDLGIEPEILAACRVEQGAVLVTGPTGSGKSTLLASIVRMRAEDPREHGKIITYEAPIEFTYEKVRAVHSIISQSEVGDTGHLKTFGDAVRNAMRRKPKVALIGESRDAETMGGAVDLALSGHALFTTLHTNGVQETVQRMTSVFPVAERGSRAVGIMQALRLIVTQRLYPKVGGGLVGAREFLVFDKEVRERFLVRPYEEWPVVASQVLRERGQSMAMALNRLYDRGLIEPGLLAGTSVGGGDGVA